MTQVHLSLKSSNPCTGKIPVSTTQRESCPPSCAFYNKGCYATTGPISWHWAKNCTMPWDQFTAAIAALPDNQIWRHNQAGDLPGQGENIDTQALSKLVRANSGRRGFTFTHKYSSKRNHKAIKAANTKGFTINLSANNAKHADKLAELNIGPVAVVLPSDQKENSFTPSGRKIVVCPNKLGRPVTCETCRLCQRSDRSVIIGFPAHGAQHAAVTKIAAQ